MESLAMINERRLSGELTLDEHEGKALLREFGIDVPLGTVVDTREEAVAAAGRIGYPVVVKGVVSAVTHKSDLGIVKVGIDSDEALASCFDEIDAKCKALDPDSRILIEQMKQGRMELVVGLTTDPIYGKVLMFGLGGIFVEILKDVSFGICPITRNDAHDMISSLRSSKMFSGVRGQESVDTEKLAELLLRLGGEGGISETFRDLIDTVEINPVMVCADGSISALDAVVKLLPPSDGKAGTARPKADMDRLFNPRSIAVVGVSPGKPSLPYDFIKHTVAAGFEGPIYPINPSHAGEELLGYRVYADIGDIDGDVDYVYIAVPAKSVPGVLRSAGKKHAGFAQIISGGFSETGAQGASLEKEALSAAGEYGVRIVGPNCLGMFSSRAHICFTTGIACDAGSVSVISQSGGITTEILRPGCAMGVAFNQAISAGNSIDLDLPDYLEYMGNDENTKVIGIYAEQIKDGVRMTQALREVCRKKPVIIMKGGRSMAGAKAAASHTGALSSSYSLFEAMCRQTGAVSVRTLEDFLHVILAFQGLKAQASNDVLLVSHSGGVVVTSTDLCEDYGLTLPPLEADWQKELLALGLPPGASVKNPMDVPLGVIAVKIREGEHIDTIRTIFSYVAQKRHYSYNIFYLMSDNVIDTQMGRYIVSDIVDFAIDFGGRGRPQHGSFALAIHGSCHPDYIREQSVRASRAGVPVYSDSSSLLMSIGKLVEYGRWLERNG